MMTISYPQSRVGSSGQCDKCNRDAGFMKESRVQINDASGEAIDLLKWTCNRCGYTMLFDLSVPRQRPLKDTEFTETMPY